MREYTQIYTKWRQSMMKISLLVCMIVAALELLNFILFALLGIVQPNEYLIYNIKYIYMPTFLNFGIYYISQKILESPKVPEDKKNETPLTALLITCFLINLIHGNYAIIFSVYLVPILLSSTYCNKKITNKIMIFSILFVITNIVNSFFNEWIVDLNYGVSLLLSIGLITASYVNSLFLITHEEDKQRLLNDNITKKDYLRERLNLDLMTELYNHNYYFNKIEYFIKTGVEKINIAVLDIDDFKKLNDTYGHDKGDLVLKELARILKQDKEGISIRYGGEEFVIIYPNCSIEEAFQKIKIIKDKFTMITFKELNHQKVTFSCGIAKYKGDGKEMFRTADQLMYQAKKTGKNKILKD